jgi:hypothetical protein
LESAQPATYKALVVIRIRGAKLRFNVLQLMEHL